MEKSNPSDTITTPSIEQVLVNIPPPDITDSAFADRIVDTFHQTAPMADDTIQVVHPHTLADALAHLAQMESFVVDSTAMIDASITRISNTLTETTQVITDQLVDQEKVSNRLTSHMEKHAKQLSNLMEYEKARRQQMDDHWKRLKDIESVLERTDKNITTMNKAIAATVRQNDRLTAQITGIRANAESAAANAKTDITNLRVRLIPEL